MLSSNVRQREAAGVDQLTRLEAEREDRRSEEGRDGWREGEVLIKEERSCRVTVIKNATVSIALDKNGVDS